MKAPVASHLQAETLPPGQFRVRCGTPLSMSCATLLPQYLCAGYSMYNETRLRDRQRKGKGTEDVELPYCEGLEV